MHPWLSDVFSMTPFFPNRIIPAVTTETSTTFPQQCTLPSAMWNLALNTSHFLLHLSLLPYFLPFSNSFTCLRSRVHAEHWRLSCGLAKGTLLCIKQGGINQVSKNVQNLVHLNYLQKLTQCRFWMLWQEPVTTGHFVGNRNTFSQSLNNMPAFLGFSMNTMLF